MKPAFRLRGLVAPMADGTTASPSPGTLVRVFGRIGLLSFGGPAGQIALMHRELVEERDWLSEEQFLHALNFCMVLPGPEAMQLATYAGWLKAGWRGGLIAGLLFVLPGFAVICGLAALYVTLGEMPLVEGLFFGLSAAVLAIVAEALLKVGRRALKRRTHFIIAVLAFLAIAFLKLPFPLVIAAAALFGALALRSKNAVVPHGDASPSGAALRQSLFSIAVFGAAWLLPLALLLVLLPGHVLSAMALFFSKAAMVTFGGAYAVLAYVGQQAVEVHGWLTAADMVTGLGLAETTPGPLILVLAFAGFVGAATAGGSLASGLAGAVTALWFTFVPCFLWVFAGAPFMERLRSVQWLSAALSAVTAAVVGVIANLALWFGLHVLFGDFATVQAGPLHLPMPDPGQLNWVALVIALVSGVALLRLHLNLLAVLAAAAGAGALALPA